MSHILTRDRCFSGSLFLEAQLMFDNEMYAQLLVILRLAMRHSIASTDSFEAEFVSVLVIPMF